MVMEKLRNYIDVAVIHFAVIVAALFIAVGCSEESAGVKSEFACYVDPMIGTDFTGHTFPGATSPFAQVQLSPDTRIDTWEGCSGYHYSDDVILGFSHTHLSGTGCLDYGDVLVMPVVGYRCDSLSRGEYSSEFSHKRESASAGYYSVWLERPRVQAELTAGQRAAMHRYTFRSGVSDWTGLIIDLQHRDVLLDSDIYRAGPCAIAGYRRSSAWSADQMVYFYMEFSVPVDTVKFFGRKGALVSFDWAGEGARGEDASGTGARRSDRSCGLEVVVKVGISSVSVENARANLESEVPAGNFDFDALHAHSVALWDRYLSKIDVREGCDDRDLLTIFYTALYHTAIAPNLYSDVNGQYRGMDRQVHSAQGFDRYTVFSLWDTFRTLHPLFTLIERERTEEFLRTFLTIYDQCGKLPIWELSGYETNCMIGFNSVSVIADAIAKGLGREYADELLDAMVESSRKDEFGISWYRKQYVVPAEKEHESVSKTLEYAYDDWCVAHVADYLYGTTGEDRYAAIRDEYLRYSGSYANVLDPVRGLARAYKSGMWETPFEPREVNNNFTEANSWQYSFFVPHDVSGLIRIHGGDSAFCAKLDSLFTATKATSGRTQVDITGLIGQYAHGNEPSHQTAYLYAYAGQPWKTYERVREILTTLYDTGADGLCGNDDCGQMSAWYVMSAIGLYPVTPGSQDYVFNAPLFDNVVITLENGRKIKIRSRGWAGCDGDGVGVCAGAGDGDGDGDDGWRRGAYDRADAGVGKRDCTVGHRSVGNRVGNRVGVMDTPYIGSVLLDGEQYTKSYITFDELADGAEIVFDLYAEPSYEFGVAAGDRPVSRGYEGFVRNPWFEASGDTFTDTLRVAVMCQNLNGVGDGRAAGKSSAGVGNSSAAAGHSSEIDGNSSAAVGHSSAIDGNSSAAVGHSSAIDGNSSAIAGHSFATAGVELYYSIDGGPFERYCEPLLLDKTTTLSIYAESERRDGAELDAADHDVSGRDAAGYESDKRGSGQGDSDRRDGDKSDPESRYAGKSDIDKRIVVRTPVITATFYKEKNDMDIRTLCTYNPQYHARGERGLVDGMRGTTNWKTGGWQGFQNTDFEAVVDLRGERRVGSIGSGYCQDARSWIWMPVYVEYFVSDDGDNFTFAGRVDHDVDPQDYTIQTKDFVLELPDPVNTRYIKVRAKNFGTIPSWHLGAGGEAFIFIDEIWVGE